MIQTIMKDGSKMRFVNGIPEEYENKIEYQIELKEDEILKVPEVKDGKLTMRDKTQQELDSSQALKDAKNVIALKERKIALKMRVIAGESINEDMSDEIAELNSLNA